VIRYPVTPLPLARGQFALFHSSLLHRSLAFGSGPARVSMAVRIARAGTELPDYGAPNPAGGAQAAAEPIVWRSGIMPLATAAQLGRSGRRPRRRAAQLSK